MFNANDLTWLVLGLVIMPNYQPIVDFYELGHAQYATYEYGVIDTEYKMLA